MSSLYYEYILQIYWWYIVVVSLLCSLYICCDVGHTDHICVVLHYHYLIIFLLHTYARKKNQMCDCVMLKMNFRSSMLITRQILSYKKMILRKIVSYFEVGITFMIVISTANLFLRRIVFHKQDTDVSSLVFRCLLIY